MEACAYPAAHDVQEELEFDAENDPLGHLATTVEPSKLTYDPASAARQSFVP